MSSPSPAGPSTTTPRTPPLTVVASVNGALRRPGRLHRPAPGHQHRLPRHRPARLQLTVRVPAGASTVCLHALNRGPGLQEPAGLRRASGCRCHRSGDRLGDRAGRQGGDHRLDLRLQQHRPGDRRGDRPQRQAGRLGPDLARPRRRQQGLVGHRHARVQLHRQAGRRHQPAVRVRGEHRRRGGNSRLGCRTVTRAAGAADRRPARHRPVSRHRSSRHRHLAPAARLRQLGTGELSTDQLSSSQLSQPAPRPGRPGPARRRLATSSSLLIS